MARPIEKGSLREVILRIIGKTLEEDFREALRAHFGPSVVTGLNDILLGRRGVTREWMSSNKIGTVLSTSFPKGWTTENSKAFYECVKALPRNQKEKAQSTDTVPKNPMLRWRHSVADVVRDMRVRSGYMDAESLAIKLAPDKPAAAAKIAELFNQVEMADPALPIRTVVGLIDKSIALVGVNPDHPDYKKLQQLKNTAPKIAPA